jgi:tetratricopeptide (TPR) repeat protein
VVCIIASMLFAVASYAQPATSAFDRLAADAAAARDAHNLGLAVDLYAKAEELRPDWTEGWWYLGTLKYAAKRYDEAIDAFDHLLRLAPTFGLGKAVRGLCEFEAGAESDALRDLNEAVTSGGVSDSQYAWTIRYHLGLLLTSTGQFENAISQFRVLAMKTAEDPDFSLAIGLAGMSVQKLPRQLSLSEKDLYKAVGEAGLKFLQRDSKSADTQFQEVFAHNPTMPNCHFFYGFLLYPYSRPMSIHQMQQELAISPSNEVAGSLLAFLLMRENRYEEVLPVARRVLAVSPDFPLAMLALGRSLIETGDEQRGIEIMNQILKTDPDNLEAHLGLAAAYSRAGRGEDAYRERMVCLALHR